MKEQDVNQIYLNRHLATIEREDAYDRAIDARVDELLTLPPTADDVYELCEYLTCNHTQDKRESLAELFRRVQATEGTQSLKEFQAWLGATMWSIMCQNRAERAQDKAIDEECRK